MANQYVIAWSIYTDLRGRNQFRKLYWDRFKDLVGRPTKLVGIEREDYNGPSHELRVHATTHFRAETNQQAIHHAISRGCRLTPQWQMLGVDARLSSFDLLEAVWYRDGYEPIRHDNDRQLPLPHLTTVMLTLSLDVGQSYRRGYTIDGRGAGERPKIIPAMEINCGNRQNFRTRWVFDVQTSAQRKIHEHHWPTIEQFLSGALPTLMSIDNPTDPSGPYRVTAEQTLAGWEEADAIAYCLERSSPLHVVLSDQVTEPLLAANAVSATTRRALDPTIARHAIYLQNLQLARKAS